MAKGNRRLRSVVEGAMEATKGCGCGEDPRRRGDNATCTAGSGSYFACHARSSLSTDSRPVQAGQAAATAASGSSRADGRT